MAGNNKSMNRAKSAKMDEFYTRRVDIENELSHYVEHFEGKTVYCNCDDPVSSEFWQFFRRNFKPWKLKRLIATHYEPDDKNYAYFLDLSQDTNGDGVVDWNDEPVVTQLPCNGDFRSAACIELLKQADIVVTNPPFSLWREYVQQLVDYDKKFLILGNMNNVGYQNVFSLMQDGRIWLGYNAGGMMFRVPDSLERDNTVIYDGVKYAKFGNICWFTNLDIPKRYVPLDLRGNYYSEEEYPKYVNYDAIEVGRVANIPCDYYGLMGVPISFMVYYCPDQFELVGTSQTLVRTLSDDVREHGDYPQIGRFYMDKHNGRYKKMAERLVIRRKERPDED